MKTVRKFLTQRLQCRGILTQFVQVNSGGPESGQKYTVEYQVAITDESVIGKEIENEVVVCSENAEEVKDRETVKVEEEPKPEPGGRKWKNRHRRSQSGGAESGRTESRRTADTCYTGSYIGEIIKSINCENRRCSKI